MLERPLRSLMFVPGHRRRMLDRALGLGEFPSIGLDAAILDLEDGVPPAEGPLARREVAAATAERTEGGPVCLVRVNRPGSPDHDEDLGALRATRVDGVVIPKVETAPDLAKAARIGLPLIPSIESARGLLNAPEIAECDGVVALLFGAEDYALDLGLPAEREGAAADLLHARSAVVVAAVAAGRVALDGIWPRIDDLAGLQRDATLARQLGFSGKSLIHPSHVAIVNEVFGPSAADIEHAGRIVRAFDEAVANGRGAVALDGKLLDAPIVERARRTLRGAARK